MPWVWVLFLFGSWECPWLPSHCWHVAMAGWEHDVQEALRQTRRKIDAERQKQKRAAPKGDLSKRLKDDVGMMVMLGVPWNCIKAMIILKRKRNKSTWKHTDITIDHIKGWATQAIHTNPELIQRAHNIQDNLVFRIHSLWKEWEMSSWIRAQNHKGIAVPTAIVKRRYIESWGSGPHLEKLSLHIDRISKGKSLSSKNWMRRFRRKWNFSYGAMPTKAPLTEREIARKVCQPHGVFFFQNGSHFWSQRWFQ